MRDMLEVEALPTGYREAIRILAVGSRDEWERKSGHLPRPGNVSFVAFADVTGALLELLRPEAVISPALARDFDCIDLALLLSALDFRGAYKATAFGLPKPQVIESEIAQLCPRLDFEIVTEL